MNRLTPQRLGVWFFVSGMWLTLPAFSETPKAAGEAKPEESRREAAASTHEGENIQPGEPSEQKRPPLVADTPIPDVVAPIEEVRSALRDNASIREMARDVQVRVEGTTFVLEGSVSSESARQGILVAVEQAARTFRVQDRMTVRKSGPRTHNETHPSK